jgi:hypothetical protein
MVQNTFQVKSSTDSTCIYTDIEFIFGSVPLGLAQILEPSSV